MPGRRKRSLIFSCSRTNSGGFQSLDFRSEFVRRRNKIRTLEIENPENGRYQFAVLVMAAEELSFRSRIEHRLRALSLLLILGQYMPISTAADFIREYLTRMGDIRGTGGATKETSYYSALENLLNHFGEQLKPKVICNGQLRNDGAGNPDFGLYSRSQIQKGEPRKGQKPERGVHKEEWIASSRVLLAMTEPGAFSVAAS